MFRTLIYPSWGACDYSAELPHWLYCSWFDVCWSFSVVGLEWCFSLQHYPVPLSRNLRTVTSWNPLGPFGPVTGMLYLLPSPRKSQNISVTAICSCCDARDLTKPSLLRNFTITIISCRRTGVKKACVVCSTSYLHMMHFFTTNESVGIETWKYIHYILLGVKATAWIKLSYF